MYCVVASTAILLAAVIYLPAVKTLALHWRWAIAIAVAIIVNIPIQGLAITGYLRGAIGDPSVTSTIIVFSLIAAHLANKPFIDKSCIHLLCLSIGAVAILFYPMALGATSVDPYWLGYQPQVLIVATLIYSFGAIIVGHYPIALIMTGVLIVYSLRLLESQNYWDYFMDPIIAGYGVFHLLKHAFRLSIHRAKKPHECDEKTTVHSNPKAPIKHFN